MITPQTATIFQTAAGWKDRPEWRVAYEHRFDQAVDALSRLTPAARRRASETLAALDHADWCLSGSWNYVCAALRLDLMGIREAGAIFRHDRLYLATLSEAAAP